MNISNLYLKPTPGATDERLTVDGSTQFANITTYAQATTVIVTDIQGADVMCTFDGSTPSASNGHRLYMGKSYPFSKAAAIVAKFIKQDATNATIHASEFTN